MAEPVNDSLFAYLMAGLGPFERRPTLAVAVSGGGDSMALCLLADTWVRRLGGRIVALTVDHGLRPESAAEAATVGQWMAARGIEHHVLPWRGDKPRSAIQAAARAARYDLLCGWSRQAGILHLMLAHQLEDQAETFLMRLNRNSGLDGLAAMAAVSETGGVRLLRPLLGVSRECLRATLTYRGQSWLDDPSNRNEAFDRVRIRQRLPAYAKEGYTPDHLGRMVKDFGLRRRRREDVVAHLLARTCTVFPAGYADVDGRSLTAADLDVAVAAIGRILGAIGGSAYRPPQDKVAALLPWFSGEEIAPSVTLARCRCLRSGGRIIVCRESRRLPASRRLVAGESLLWDDRFTIEVADPIGKDLTLAPLGREGWAEVVAQASDLRRTALPYPVRLTLPTIRDSGGIFAIPHLGFRRLSPSSTGPWPVEAQFSPRNSLSGIGFCLAPQVSSTI